MNHNPTVSIIIPAYNVEHFIEEAIHSVTSQSFKDIEVIVVNDGSTDKTLKIAEQIAKSDNRVNVINQNNSGKPSIARNAGISACSGEYIAFHDADDVMLPGKIQAQVDVFKKINDVSLIFHDWSLISNEGELLTPSRLSLINFLELSSAYLERIEEDIYITNHHYYNYASTDKLGIHTITVMLKKDILYAESEWFPEDMDIGEDLDLWYRIISKHCVAFINKSYSQYRKHPHSITMNDERMIYGLINAQERNLKRGLESFSKNEIKTIKYQLAEKYRNLAYIFYIRGNTSKAAKYYKKSFFLRPNIKHLVSLLKTGIHWSSAT